MDIDKSWPIYNPYIESYEEYAYKCALHALALASKKADEETINDLYESSK